MELSKAEKSFVCQVIPRLLKFINTVGLLEMYSISENLFVTLPNDPEAYFCVQRSWVTLLFFQAINYVLCPWRRLDVAL